MKSLSTNGIIKKKGSLFAAEKVFTVKFDVTLIHKKALMNYYLLLCSLSLFTTTSPLTDPSLDEEYVSQEALHSLYKRYERRCISPKQLPAR